MRLSSARSSPSSLAQQQANVTLVVRGGRDPDAPRFTSPGLEAISYALFPLFALAFLVVLHTRAQRSLANARQQLLRGPSLLRRQLTLFLRLNAPVGLGELAPEDNGRLRRQFHPLLDAVERARVVRERQQGWERLEELAAPWRGKQLLKGVNERYTH